MKIADAARAAAELLEQAGFAPEDARRDVSVLARHILNWSLTEWAAGAGQGVSPRFAMRLFELARRRAAREPVAYITGVRDFYGRPFRVTRDVLVPRPETEGVIEAALSAADTTEAAQAAFDAIDAAQAAFGATASPRILDVGTGSGCLAVTIALEVPGARVIATDISAAALEVARANARALGASNVEFVETAFWPAALAPFDLIVSNPPYVPDVDRAMLPADVREFEPASALFAGTDGLDVVRELVPRAARALSSGGWLIFEIGAGQAEASCALTASAGLEVVDVRPDLQGIPRVIVARRSEVPAGRMATPRS